MSPTPTAAKTERLLNLVLALLATRRPLTKEHVRRAVPQYEQSDEAAFDRMFERDKDELRDLGIPLVTEHLSTFFLDEPGYRIDRREYALPPIEFSPDEIDVLGLAARTWAQGSMAPRAAAALRKLAAAGVETPQVRDEQEQAALVVGTSDRSFEALRAAVITKTAVRFSYRKAGGEQLQRRHVQPWRLQMWHGRWYVVGFDVDRQEPRSFRLDRIQAGVRKAGQPGAYEVPDDFDALAMIRRGADPAAGGVARIHVAVGAGFELRRRALDHLPPVGTEEVVNGVSVPPGFDTVCVQFHDVARFGEELAAYGGDVVVVEPTRLRDCVVTLLRGCAVAHSPQGGMP